MRQTKDIGLRAEVPYTVLVAEGPPYPQYPSRRAEAWTLDPRLVRGTCCGGPLLPVPMRLTGRVPAPTSAAPPATGEPTGCSSVARRYSAIAEAAYHGRRLAIVDVRGHGAHPIRTPPAPGEPPPPVPPLVTAHPVPPRKTAASDRSGACCGDVRRLRRVSLGRAKAVYTLLRAKTGVPGAAPHVPDLRESLLARRSPPGGALRGVAQRHLVVDGALPDLPRLGPRSLARGTQAGLPGPTLVVPGFANLCSVDVR